MTTLATQLPLSAHKTSLATLLRMVWARTLLFIVYQALIALGLALVARQPEAWQASAAWWPWTATLTSLTTLALLSTLLRREGKSLAALYPFSRQTIKQDLLALAGVMVIAMPSAFFPMIWLGSRLFGDPQAPLHLFVRPLPLWAAVPALVLFPLTVALSELPTYFGYIMPRLHALTGSRWLAILLPVLALAAQHMALPLIFDVRFLLWRLLMFIPFALVAGLALFWRPRLLPYMMVVHGLMDLQMALMVLGLAY